MAQPQHGVARHMRQRRMARMPLKSDIKPGAGRHHRPLMHRHRAHRQARPIVPAKDAVHRETLEQPIGNHRPRAATPLLRRLEHQLHRAGPGGVIQQQLGRAQQRRGMAVMAASMHHARNGARPGQRQIGLLDRQRIHISAQPHRPIRPLPAAPPQGRHHTMAAHAGGDLAHPQFAQFLDHKGRSVLLVQREARMGVEVTSPLGEAMMQRCIHVARLRGPARLAQCIHRRFSNAPFTFCLHSGRTTPGGG